ncbi:SulP family inorganic anion transporter [Rhizobacter sp. Root1221]|uniref:SulP family inorganic anion transporter n=1 Tax=Rhizobacter sp. Root1221 TaxID=1736433 RepID=UPI0006FF4D7B|nr:SulP family inorganic anion transporter [Rhizobacter sp. Root1221]KQV90457.1 sulfate transporter [Rhizobacter sp. Root1221]
MEPRRIFGIPLARFRPRLLQSLGGYNRQRFASDTIAGLTVGVVALPLAMAFAIASGVKPEQGLITAIVAGFLISALGGSSVQIGGPAGAFIVVVYGIVQRYGLTNLLISTALAGVLLFAMGALRLGALVRYMPVGIIIGFTNGIAVLIALSQVKDLLGLNIEKMPADFFSQVGAIAGNLDGFNPFALALGAACLGILFLWPRLFGAGSVIPSQLLEGRTLRTAARVPGPLVALVALTLASLWLALPVDTIGTRFGGIPQGLPTLALPPFSWASAQQLFVPTLTIALLGAVESLLCARIADNLSTQPRHDPNQELMAQGIANMAVPLFGGIPATGTIARTVTNLRAGATSPVAGIVHALTLLMVVLVAAPLAEHIPLPVLAGILLFVAWNMGEWHEFRRLRQFNTQYRLIMVGTFFLTVVVDLTVAVQVGLVLACVFFIYRMSALFRVEPAGGPAGVAVFRLYGALFFGAVAKVEAVAEAVPADARVVVLEMHQLVSMDTSGLDALQQLHRTLARQGVALVLCELNDQPLSLVRRSGFDALLGEGRVAPDLAQALQQAARLAPA